MSKDHIEIKYLSYGQNKAADKLQSLVSRLTTRQDTVVDIGCGGGGFSKGFFQYIGIDIDKKLLTIANKTKRDGQRYVCADAAHLPLRNNSVDFFVSMSMLEHTDDPESIIAEIRRTCSGTGIFVLPCRDTIPLLYDPINYWLIRRGLTPLERGAFGYGHVNLKSKQQWQDLITEAGFRVLSMEPFDNSAIQQLEFFTFSLLFNRKHYSDLPTRTVTNKTFEQFKRIHKLISLFDFTTRRSFSWSYVVA